MWVRSFRLVAVLFLVVSCSSQGSSPASAPGPDGGGGRDSGSSSTVEAGRPAENRIGRSNLRVVAANITSGAGSTYDPGDGIRMLQGLKPDVALIQELRYGTNSATDLKKFVTEAFGADYGYYREEPSMVVDIPNAVVSRYPILESGEWVDPEVENRSFVYAKLDVPGPHALWAVSVHFATANSTKRANEATALVGHLKEVVAGDDFVVVGGDLNTDARGEPCIGTLRDVVETSAPHPADGAGNGNTNAPRSKPYDWVLASTALGSHQVPTVIGESSFPSGLVFDSRVYTPLADVAPVEKGDSAATNMQHMPVVKDFALPD